jgi:hypothetical protein
MTLVVAVGSGAAVGLLIKSPQAKVWHDLVVTCHVRISWSLNP